MDRDTEQERRHASVPIEKTLALVISGAALAFAVYTYGTGYLDGLRSDIDRVASEHAVLASRFSSYVDQSGQWNDRIRLLETRCSEIRERLGSDRGR